MKVLFICSANQQRSRTAEDLFSELRPVHDYLSAGTNLKICRQLGTQEITEDLAQWADKIIVMESKHQKDIQRLLGSDYNMKCFVLNILDRYNYGQKELKELLKRKCEDLF